MTIDWNWFFSSFAQSAAALIGIIAAFIISRLLGLSEKIGSAISQFDSLIIDANKIIAGISKRRFYWYTKTNVRYSSSLKTAIQKGEYDNLKTDETLKKIYESHSLLYKDDNAVIETFKLLFLAHSPQKKNSERQAMIASQLIKTETVPVGIWDRLNEEKEAINQLEIEARTIIQQFEQNLQELNSFRNTIRPLQVIIILLMIAFPITVIYPLHFMPVAVNENPTITFNILTILKSLLSIKSLLLIAFFAAIEGMFYYFYVLTTQLNVRLRTAIQNNSNDRRSIKTYSKYFN